VRPSVLIPTKHYVKFAFSVQYLDLQIITVFGLQVHNMYRAYLLLVPGNYAHGHGPLYTVEKGMGEYERGDEKKIPKRP
jgi:hypothetical protein